MSAMPPFRSGAARAYFVALFLCPPAFRREFSSEMVLDLEDAIADAKGARWRERAALCTVIATDFAKTVVVQWLKTGAPILLLLSVLGATTAVSVAAQVLPRQLFPVPHTLDGDFVTLMVLIGGVLFIIVATILFSFWFTSPLLRRHRR